MYMLDILYIYTIDYDYTVYYIYMRIEIANKLIIIYNI